MREIGFLQVHTGYLTFSFNKPWLNYQPSAEKNNKAEKISGLQKQIFKNGHFFPTKICFFF